MPITQSISTTLFKEATIVWYYAESKWSAYSNTFANQIENDVNIATLNTLANHPKLNSLSQGWSMLGVAKIIDSGVQYLDFINKDQAFWVLRIN